MLKSDPDNLQSTLDAVIALLLFTQANYSHNWLIYRLIAQLYRPQSDVSVLFCSVDNTERDCGMGEIALEEVNSK